VEQHLTLTPYESDILGPVLFIPPNTANIVYNLSLYVANNYTGVERIDVVFGSGAVSMQANRVAVLDSPPASSVAVNQTVAVAVAGEGQVGATLGRVVRE